MRSRDDVWEEIRECDRQIEGLNKKATKQAFFYSAGIVALLMVSNAKELSGSAVATWFIVGIPVLTFLFKTIIFNMFPTLEDATLYKREAEYRKRELMQRLSDY